MDDREAHTYYLNPEHLKPSGPGLKRKRPTLSSMIPVRFTPEFIERVKSIAFTEGLTVSAWIRRAAMQAVAQAERQRPVGIIADSGRPGEPRALRSSLSGPGMFRCPHMSIGGVVSAACSICGPLQEATA